jgi:hypothetical protein
VILQALELISALQESQKDSEQSINSSNKPGQLIDPTTRRTVYGLLDLISIEGIYPSLSPDVGQPLELRVKSTLAGTSTTSQSSGLDQVSLRSSLLPRILECLLPISLAGSKGLGPSIRDRILIDLLASAFELAYNPTIAEPSRKASQDDLAILIDGYDIQRSFIYCSLIMPTPKILRRTRQMLMT